MVAKMTSLDDALNAMRANTYADNLNGALSLGVLMGGNFVGIPVRNDLDPTGTSHEVDCSVPMRIASLQPSDSPRVAGEDTEHVRALVEAAPDLPPIVVHRPTRRVVDGMHRLRAAQLRGDTHIAAQLVDGDDNDVFVLAVRLNAQHGLPLTRIDRVRAAERIIGMRVEWSDRMIASVTGLSHKTIGAIRRRSTGEILQSNSRIGRDGRVRPRDVMDRRSHATDLMTRNPGSSLRQIAREAGISISTAKDVRDRLLAENSSTLVDGPEAVSIGSTGTSSERACATSKREPAVNEPKWSDLRRDPSLRHTSAGRALLRLLAVHSLNADEWQYLVDRVPEHRREDVAEVAQSCARLWTRFAQQLGRKTG